ncbi:hypothetical protein ABC347_16415 [Sphingomonas sp. 1P06PA]|uniref:hypothetical protein n=1 Tax=Sphingomonas sp. 1P06PA TaxID=554121 RepID=UPI0039A77A0D
MPGNAGKNEQDFLDALRGASAADIARAQGLIAADASDTDFIAWLAGVRMPAIPATGIAYRPPGSDGSARFVSDKLREQRSLLDFLPYARIAPILEGRSTWDCSDAINAGLRDMGPGVVTSPSGASYAIGQPIRLQRGTALRHLGAFEDLPGKGAIIRLLSGANCAAIQTPAAADPTTPATHYTCIEGFCIDGNAAGQSRPVAGGIVQWWGQWIGSEISRLMVKDSLGPALTLDRGSDVALRHIWLVGAVLSADGYAFDTNMGITGDQRSGLLDIDHLFVEHPKTQAGADTMRDPAVRANAVRLHRLVAARIGRTHIEGARRAITLASCDLVDIEQVSGAWLGDPRDPRSALVDYADAGTRTVRIGTMLHDNPGNAFVAKRVGVRSNWLPDQRGRGRPISAGYAASNDPGPGYVRRPPTLFANDAGVEAVGEASPIYWRLQMGAPSGLIRYGYMRQDALALSIGATLSQPGNAEKDFIRLLSYGNPGDAVELGAPMLLAARPGPDHVVEGALYRDEAGPVYQRRTGAGTEHLSSVRLAAAPPTRAPDGIGILHVAQPTGRVWLSVGMAGVGDWLALN